MTENTSQPVAASPVPRGGRSYWAIVWAQFRQNRGAMIGLFMTGAFFLFSFLAPFLAHRLPLYWQAADGTSSYPLLREFFAPSDTTEAVLETAFNFLFLFLPLALLAWRVAGRLYPRIDEYASTRIGFAIGVLASAALALGMGYLFISIDFTQPLTTWGAQLLKDLGEVPWLSGLGILALLVFVPFFSWLILSLCGDWHASPRWVVLLGLAVLLALPFAFVQARNDQTDYRLLAETGQGSGLFPLVRYGPNEQGFGDKLPPSWWKPDSRSEGQKKKETDKPGYHWLGTDEVSRDVLVRVIHGARVSLSVGFVSVVLATLIGIVVGASAGYFGGRIDAVLLRLIEITICFPSFFLILTIIAILDKRSILNIMLVIGLTGWTGVARLVRAEVLRQKKLDYVSSAVALGASHRRVIFRHIMPNAIAPVLVSVTFGIAGAILTESGLSFLGFGVAPPTPTWGELLNQSREAPLINWWLVVFPGLIIFLGVFAYNLVGEGLRDAMDPRLKQ